MHKIMNLKVQTKRLEKISTICATFAISSMGVSISFTHFAITLAFLFYISSYVLKRFTHKQQENTNIEKHKLPTVFVVALLLYALITFSSLYQAILSNEIWKNLNLSIFSELGDVFLLLFGLLVWHLSAQKDRLRILVYGVVTCISLLIVTGILSIFIERVEGSWFNLINTNTQVFLKSIEGMPLHRTQGFLGLSLTYAGILILILPLFPAGIIYYMRQKKQYYKAILVLLLGLIVLMLLWTSGSRSASIAFFICLPLLAYFFFRDISINIFTHYTATIICIALSSFIIFFIFVKNSSFSTKINFSSQKQETSLQKPYTRDANYRNTIWHQSGKIIQDNLLYGIGAGHYSNYVKKQWENYHAKNKNLNLISSSSHFPKGHAHNDLLHITAIAGLPAGLLFLLIIYLSVQSALRNRTFWGPYLLCGCITFFIAGLAQCYFLDDEVVVLFWTLTALAHRGAPIERKQSNISFLFGKKIWQKTKQKLQNYYPALQRSVLFFIISAIMSIPISISATQLSISFIFLNFLLLLIIKSHIPLANSSKKTKLTIMECNTKNIPLPLIFKVIFLFFFSIFLSNFWNALQKPQIEQFQSFLIHTFTRSDMFLMLFGLVIFYFINYYHSYKGSIMRTVEIMLFLLVLTGICTLFYPYPLSTLIAGEKILSIDEMQNKLFSLGTLQIYSPQGFMSTRLTYAGILILGMPLLLGRSFVAFMQNNLRTGFIFLFIFSSGFIILCLSGVRSALFGLLISFVFLFWSLYLNSHEVQNLLKKYRKKLGYTLILFSCFILLATSFFIYNDMLTMVLKPFMRLSDFGRITMWAENSHIIAQNPLWGVGSQNFLATRTAWQENFLSINPDSWYFTQFIPKGHMHSDLLHISYNNGLLSALLFSMLMFLCARYMYRACQHLNIRDATKSRNMSPFLFSGCIAFFFAGFAQCYFQDDEVAVLFWLVLALGVCEYKQPFSTQIATKNKKQLE